MSKYLYDDNVRAKLIMYADSFERNGGLASAAQYIHLTGMAVSTFGKIGGSPLMIKRLREGHQPSPSTRARFGYAMRQHANTLKE